jgi:GNAT superfamily N-acetyltransferase
MELVDVKVYYLEMLARPPGEVRPPRNGLLILHARRPTVAYYRFLYNSVGQDYYWLSRRKMSDEQLDAILANPLNEVFVLHVDGAPAGFVEFDRRTDGEVEIVQFGLMREWIGQGLGKYFLCWAIDQAWSYAPRRVWLHTCTLDHPAALANYQKAGFSVYKDVLIQREL